MLSLLEEGHPTLGNIFSDKVGWDIIRYFSCLRQVKNFIKPFSLGIEITCKKLIIEELPFCIHFSEYYESSC